MDFTEEVLADLRKETGSFLHELHADKRPIVERNLRELARLQIELLSSGDDRVEQNIRLVVGTLQDSLAETQIKAARAARDFLDRITTRALDFAFRALDAAL